MVDLCKFFNLVVLCVFDVVVCYGCFLCVVEEVYVMLGVISY